MRAFDKVSKFFFNQMLLDILRSIKGWSLFSTFYIGSLTADKALKQESAKVDRIKQKYYESQNPFIGTFWRVFVCLLRFFSLYMWVCVCLFEFRGMCVEMLTEAWRGILWCWDYRQVWKLSLPSLLQKQVLLITELSLYPQELIFIWKKQSCV